MQDAERFLAHLRGQGLDEKQLGAYRRYLDELGKYPRLSAAINAAEGAGVPEREIANMKKVAQKLAEFVASSAEPALEVEPRPPRAAATPALDVEPKAPLAAPYAGARAPRGALAQVLAQGTPRLGCRCNKRYDAYLDNDFGALAKVFGGGLGIGTFLLIRLIGVLGALTMALSLAATGGAATIVSICMRCEGCRHRVRDLDEDERATVKKGRGLVVLVTLGLLAAAALCGYIWWRAVQTRYTQPDF